MDNECSNFWQYMFFGDTIIRRLVVAYAKTASAADFCNDCTGIDTKRYYDYILKKYKYKSTKHLFI